jgi:purine-binding chemotaxis protein CheW
MFASFRLGSSELAISVSSLQEVVNFPDKISTIPLAPDYLTGIFNLRGVVIPIVDIGKMLGIDTESSTANKKIAVVSTQNVRIGMLFDSTSEILNVAPEAVCSYQDAPEGNKAVIRSVLKLEGGDRLVEVIEPSSLLKIENIAAVIEHGKGPSEEATRKKAKRCQCISFRAGGIEFGMEISAIREIVRVPEIKRSVLAVDYCLGMVNLRGMIIPILDLQRFLKLGEPQTMDIEKKRIVVLKLDQVQVGFMVDSVDSIVTYFEDELLPIPLFQQDKMDMMAGMLPRPDGGNVLFLNEAKILTTSEIIEITRGHSSLYGKDDSRIQTTKEASSERKPYISFKLDYLLSARLSSIDEIAKVTEDIMKPPGYPNYVVGVMKMRGEVMMLIDLRAYYGMTPTENPANSRILVIKTAKGKMGLLVDTVESIDTVDEANKLQIPMILAQGAAAALRGDMREVVEMTDLSGNKKTFMILDVPELMKRLEQQAA